MTVTLKRVGGLTLGAATMMILAGTWSLPAQESKSKSKSADTPKAKAKRTLDPSRRVPNHFGQLGLSDEQRETIYKIQARHMPKIDALEKQIDELRAEMVKECENVLSATQKQMLADRRAGATAARAKKAKAAARKQN